MIPFLIGTSFGATLAVIALGRFVMGNATDRQLQAARAAGWWERDDMETLKRALADDGEFLAENAEAGARGLRA